MDSGMNLWRLLVAGVAAVGACVALLAPGAFAILGLATALGAVAVLYLLPGGTSKDDGRLDDLALEQEPAGVLDEPAFLRSMSTAIATGGGALLVIEAASIAPGSLDSSNMIDTESRLLIAQAVRQSVRHDDIVGFNNSGELTVFLRGAEQARTEEIADRICNAVRDTIFLGENATIADIGVAIGGTLATPAADHGLVLQKAHANLRRAKTLGPNNYAVAA